MDYVLAVLAPAYPTSATSFATESAFAEHLKELRRRIGRRFHKLVLLAPRLSHAEYAASQDHLGVVELARDEVQYIPLHPAEVSAKEFWLTHARQTWRQLAGALANAAVVQSGVADDTYRPWMGMLNLAAWRKKVPVVFVVDIDFRRHTDRNYALGTWGLKSSLVNKLLHDPLRWGQVWLAPRMFQLVLLKSASMVEDFGKGRSNVRNFYDTVHTVDDLLAPEALEARLAWLRDGSRPLELCYFGRYVAYKGLDRAIEAVALARKLGANVRLTLIGSGECEQALRQQVAQLALADAVVFRPPVRYGDELFRQLRDVDLSIYTPLMEDTPRSAFDAMARGIPLVAFDIGYFRDLARESKAVAVSRWPDTTALAEELLALSRDRQRVAKMAENAIGFARENTQTEWLARRTDWVLEVIQQVQQSP